VLQATRTTAGGRLFRLLIGALILVSAAAQFALVPVMPVYARRLGLSGFEQGMVLGATGLATLVVSVPAGTLADRFGARRITLAAGLLMAAATAAQALAGDFPALLAARLAFGAGYGMVWTAGLCWAGRRHGRRPARPGRLRGQRRRRRGGRARRLRRARPEPRLGPFGAGVAAEHVGAAAAFGLTDAVCAAALAVTAVLAWRGRRPSGRAGRPGQVGHRLHAEVERRHRLPGRAEP
jgi:MFS family permease